MIPEGVNEIKNWAFAGCTSLQSIEIPDSVTTIGYSAFSGCSSLQSIVISNSVTKIGHVAFRGCSSLQSIEIPDSVTKIGVSAFDGCTSLQSISIKTKEKDPDLSSGKIEYLLQTLSKYSKEICLIVPIGRGYAYRHYPAFEGKFKTIIADIDA